MKSCVLVRVGGGWSGVEWIEAETGVEWIRNCITPVLQQTPRLIFGTDECCRTS